MNTYKCIKVNNKKTRKIFLDLPRKLYKDDCPQDRKAEKSLLEGKHPLSGDIETVAFVVTDIQKKAVCRCLLTYYKDDPTAYLGFFEAYDDDKAVSLMIREAEKKALSDGKSRLIGPINASIYIGYRFKADRFDKTYTGEPYNKEYYPRLWMDCGFSVCERYVSNQIRAPLENDTDPKLSRLYRRYVDRGYRFVSPSKKTFKKCLTDVYDAMMRLYTSFAGFKPLSKEQFLKLFSPLEKLLDFNMAKLVYKDGKLCAFCINLPNYRHLTRGKTTLSKLLKISKIKKSSDEYVILYMGAEPKDPGLGGALIHACRDLFFKKGVSSIGALIKEGNVTGRMYDTLYTDKFSYLLLSKELNTQDTAYDDT